MTVPEDRLDLLRDVLATRHTLDKENAVYCRMVARKVIEEIRVFQSRVCQSCDSQLLPMNKDGFWVFSSMFPDGAPPDAFWECPNCIGEIVEDDPTERRLLPMNNAGENR